MALSFKQFFTVSIFIDVVVSNPVIASITPHYFRHNYATLLFEAGVEPLIAMKMLGHTAYQTTANIYTHLKSEMLKNPAWIWRTYSAGRRKLKMYWQRRRPQGTRDPGSRYWI